MDDIKRAAMFVLIVFMSLFSIIVIAMIAYGLKNFIEMCKIDK